LPNITVCVALIGVRNHAVVATIGNAIGIAVERATR
jgi:hypothetical protein